MIDRREFFGITIGAAAALAFTPELLGARKQSGGKLIQRAIPSSGEKLPVIGLGRARRRRAPGRAEATPYVRPMRGVSQT